MTLYHAYHIKVVQRLPMTDIIIISTTGQDLFVYIVLKEKNNPRASLRCPVEGKKGEIPTPGEKSLSHLHISPFTQPSSFLRRKHKLSN